MNDLIHAALRSCSCDAPDARGAARRITVALATTRTMSRSQMMVLRSLRNALADGRTEQAESAVRALLVATFAAACALGEHESP
jgi:cytosine/adenosine deaminase-related metal-dependent hydrolase